MTAKIIDGQAIAQRLRKEVKEAVAKRIAEGRSTPGLATVLVGEDPASKVYVRSNKELVPKQASIPTGTVYQVMPRRKKSNLWCGS